MQNDISKHCSDCLRDYAVVIGAGKLKASHARELVAAFFGYNSHAALLAETAFPIDELQHAAILVPDVPRMTRRRAQLEGLPLLPDSKTLSEALIQSLHAHNFFKGKAWIYDSLESYVEDVLLREEDSRVMDLLSGVMAETNAYFDEAHYEGAELADSDEGVAIEVQGTYYGSSDEDRPFCGDKIDIQVIVELTRVASRVGFSEPDISATGIVNDDWVDPEFKATRLVHQKA